MNASPTFQPNPWTAPEPIGAALDRASKAELHLNSVFPLFATKLEDAMATGSYSVGMAQATLELEAFAAQFRVAHRAALQSLAFYREKRTRPEAVAAAYDSLAVLIETFASRASLDAIELEES
jgi:hypothetical protein